MSVDEFIKTWQNSTLTERSASQQHFVQLCHLLGEKTPAEVDPDGTFFTFEKAVTKASGTSGRADVWLRNCFIWEYKGKNKDLNAAFVQAQQYAPYLENPPLLIVSDMHRIEIHTNFTSTVKRIEVITLADLRDPQKLNKLKALFDREQIEQVFNPDRVRERITLQMAELFAALAQRLREGKHDPQQVAHFINRLVFCMFAEDIGILPKNLFTKLLESILKPLKKDGANNFQKRIGELFSAMRTGGDFGTEEIAWFNGGLFDDDSTLPLDKTDIEQLLKAASYDWKEIDPSIFGTLFERGLDPNKRSQLGAHYTDRSAILRILEPVIFTPLHQEWQAEKAKITALLKTTPDKKVAKKNQFEAAQLCNDFLMRLGSIQVLDPACGSGNFLYLALLGLKDLERKVLLETAELGLGTQIPFSIHPRNFYGIEINPYAVELARMSIWIGYIQWMLTYNYGLKDSPILETLDNIQCCDALIDENGLEKEWKAVDFIVGNPPFLGDKRMISILGEEYVFHLRDLFQGRVAGGADLVCYWFEKARAQLEQGKVKNVGLVSTNSIRGGSNRKVLENITATGKIFHAWSDEPWINEGAAVRVSLVCFQDKSVNSNSGLPVLDSVLNNQAVAEIYSDLTAPNSINSEQSLDLTKAVQLAENKSISFIGTQKNGAFDITGDLAREWLKTGFNPHGKPNSDVVRPWANGMDVTRRYSDTWIIDFGVNMSEDDASLYEKPFEYV
ncbi:MAG: hypothetical protein RIS84_1751, partial [Pseudomonadota bacterium]